MLTTLSPKVLQKHPSFYNLYYETIIRKFIVTLLENAKAVLNTYIFK